MLRTYSYLGPAELARIDAFSPQRFCVREAQDVLHWINETGQTLDAAQSVTATFIVDTDGALWIADRHSEHVQCARGQDILSAGEMTFTVAGQFANRKVEVSAITNQSTGYCPEPESWPAVDAALRNTGLPYPSTFTTAMIFRCCPACGTKNIVKDGWFECGVCQSALPTQWNFLSIRR